MNKYDSIKNASVLGIVGNLFLCIIKGIVGYITNSRSMIADMFNSLGDIFSSLMTYIGNIISSKPRDEDHDLGHGKAEYIYSLFISIVMAAMAFRSFIDSFRALFGNSKYIFSKWLIVVSIITIFIKFLLFMYTRYVALKFNNILIRANSMDHRNDMLVTFFTLISSLSLCLGIKNIDGIIGMGISLYIMIPSFKIFKESYDVLMDKAISKEIKDRVVQIIDRYPEIKRYNHFNSTPLGYRYQISISIFVDGNISTYDSHMIADRLEKEIISEVSEIYLAIIHVNPI